MNEKKPQRQIRSFVKRDNRLTENQKKALQEFFPLYGLTIKSNHPMILDNIFEYSAPLILEIGFGNGESLLSLAEEFPKINFVGIEVYLPGISKVLNNIHSKQLKNIRIFCDDAIDVLTHSIPDHCLDRIQIFFPDPWPKRRHHKRRLIQEDFLKLIHKKLKHQGTFHIKTDWEDYAKSILKVINLTEKFENIPELHGSSGNITTKFEKRSKKLGHEIYDLKFIVKEY